MKGKRRPDVVCVDKYDLMCWKSAAFGGISSAPTWKNAHTCVPSAMDAQPVCEHWSWISPPAFFFLATFHWHLHLWEIPLTKEKTHFYSVRQRGDTRGWSMAQFGGLDESPYQRLINSMNHPRSLFYCCPCALLTLLEFSISGSIWNVKGFVQHVGSKKKQTPMRWKDLQKHTEMDWMQTEITQSA